VTRAFITKIPLGCELYQQMVLCVPVLCTIKKTATDTTHSLKGPCIVMLEWLGCQPNCELQPQ